MYKPRHRDDILPEMPLDCKEQATTENSELCIFHDDKYFEGHEQEASKRFEDKVKESINQNKPLICFGYYLPSIDFTKLLEGKTVPQSVYFNGAAFSKEANFLEATFTEGANRIKIEGKDKWISIIDKASKNDRL